MEESGSLAQSTRDLENLIRREVGSEVRAYINKLASLLGIANIAVLVGMIAYAVETLPEKAAKFIIERETGTISNVQDRVNQFQRDLDGAIRQFGAFNSEMEREKGDMHKISAVLTNDLEEIRRAILSINAQIDDINGQIKDKRNQIGDMTSEISRTKLAFQPLRATTEDIERAKNTLMLAHNTEMQSGAALLAKIDSVEKGMKTLDTRVKALVSGQENIDLLSVKRMRIKDAQGRERGFFGVMESNILDLSLKDDNGKARLSVTTGPNGIPSLYIRDAKEVTRVKLYEDQAGYAGVGLIDSNEKWRMFLATNPKDGRASLTLQNAEENGRVQLYENQSGYAGIGLIDSDKKWRMLLTTNPKGGRASLELWNAEGNSRVQLYESEAGDAGIRFTDNNKKQRMSLLTNPKDGRASLELRNAEGNNRVQLYENQFYFDGKDRFLQLPSPQAGAR